MSTPGSVDSAVALAKNGTGASDCFFGSIDYLKTHITKQDAKQSIKAFYMKEYPKDELGQEIDAAATFNGLFSAMDRYKDVYQYIGVNDSIVRERVFEKLASIAGVEYDYIYKQWLKGN